jgi:mono/diheme cytochrome c family protein
MRMKRIGVLVVLALAIAAALVLWHRDDEGPRGSGVTGSAEQVKRGEYLARAGNCFGCHTVRGKEPYAGGVAIPTPFGTLYSSNITADADTGIAAWSADDFWNALHKGLSRDGSYLYPAFRSRTTPR